MEKLSQILEQFGWPAIEPLDFDALHFPLPEACVKAMRQSAEGFRAVKAVGDEIFSPSAPGIPFDARENFLRYLFEAAHDRVDLLPVERWCLQWLESQEMVAGSWASERLAEIFYDPWSLARCQSRLPWFSLTDSARAIADRHFKLESWLADTLAMQIDSVRRFGQGSAAGDWIGDYARSAERRSDAPELLAVIAVLGVGPLLDLDERGRAPVFDGEPVASPKSWRHGLFKSALARLEGTGASAPDRRPPDPLRKTAEFRVWLERLWSSHGPVKTGVSELRAFHFLSIALGVCPFDAKDELIDRFPGQHMNPSFRGK